MITKTDLLDSMLHECTVAQHLFTKIPASGFEYRPGPKQRTTAELLQYLSIIGIAGATCIVSRDWKLFGPFSERVKEMRSEEFLERMDRQKAELIAFFKELPDERLATGTGLLPGGGQQPLAVALMNGPLKWLTAYKLQLFLYAKAAGAEEIGTSNAWGGRDLPPKT
jgi:hypothetical protein